MPNQPAPETELLRAAYAAFNARDIDAALALMTPDVTHGGVGSGVWLGEFIHLLDRDPGEECILPCLRLCHWRNLCFFR